jgi:glyoxylase-like metal-dependent hydrolase (beta-lactamase superfamily II)
MNPKIEPFFDERTYTLTYVVYDPDTKDAVVIDPVLDYEPKASKTWTESVDEVINFVKEKDLNLHYVIETHAHADHLSGSQMIKAAFPNAKVGIGRDITKVQEVFKDVFDLPEDFPTDGRQFDALFEPGGSFKAGSLEFDVIPTPGHTPACVTYKIDDNVFTGDVMFMPDQGTGRCDFPGGSAEDMYESVNRLYELPEHTNVWVGHDYQPGGREVAFRSTVGEQKEKNVALPAARTKDDFVKWRQTRDSTLDAPRLLFQSVQVNVDAGALPEPHKNELRYLKIPINAFSGTVAPEDSDVSLEEVQSISQGATA